MKEILLYYSPYIPFIGFLMVYLTRNSKPVVKFCFQDNLFHHHATIFIQTIGFAIFMINFVYNSIL